MLASPMLLGLVWMGSRATTPSSPGCYVDCDKGAAAPVGCNGRILPHLVAMYWANMTAELCTNTCREKGFALSGVESAHSCFCGNALTQPKDLQAVSAKHYVTEPKDL